MKTRAGRDEKQIPHAVFERSENGFGMTNVGRRGRVRSRAEARPPQRQGAARGGGLRGGEVASEGLCDLGRSGGPLGHGVARAAIEAGGDGELSGTGRANGQGLKGVERGSALGANPVLTDRRRSLARGAGETDAARGLGQAKQSPRVIEAVPAIQENEDGENAEPDGLLPQGESKETNHANKSEHRGHKKAAGAANDKPEKGAENLAAIERIDGKHVENEQADVDDQNGAKKSVEIGHGRQPVRVVVEQERS